MSTTWIGDWRARIRQRLKERGFASMTEFAGARPNASLLTLAHELGEEDVAAIQVEDLLHTEAFENRTMARFARDLFARRLHEEIPDGWNVSDRYDFRFRKAGAYASWGAAFFEEDEAAADTAYECLLAQPIPRGWLPTGPDDPLLLRAFEGVVFPTDVRTGPRPPPRRPVGPGGSRA